MEIGLPGAWFFPCFNASFFYEIRVRKIGRTLYTVYPVTQCPPFIAWYVSSMPTSLCLTCNFRPLVIGRSALQSWYRGHCHHCRPNLHRGRHPYRLGLKFRRLIRPNLRGRACSTELHPPVGQIWHRQRLTVSQEKREGRRLMIKRCRRWVSGERWNGMLRRGASNSTPWRRVRR